MNTESFQTHILLPIEAEAYVENLDLFQISEIGCPKYVYIYSRSKSAFNVHGFYVNIPKLFNIVQQHNNLHC